MFLGDNRYLGCVFSLRVLNRDLKSFAFKVSIERVLLFPVILLPTYYSGWLGYCMFFSTFAVGIGACGFIVLNMGCRKRLTQYESGIQPARFLCGF